MLYASEKISLDELINNLGDCVAIADNNLVFKAINKNFSQFYGLPPEALIGKKILEIYPDFKNSVFYSGAEETLKTGKPVTRIGYSNNAKNWIVVRTAKFDENHTIWSTHLLKEELKSNYISSYDNLTSIQNRFAIEDKLNNFFINKTNFSLFIIDILKFKTINDSFGVTQGDMILMEFAARLKKNLNKEAEVYRYNADQFAVILNNIDEISISKIIESIHQSKKEPFIAQSNQLFIDLAIGYSAVDYFNNNFQEIITNTEMALIKAKKIKSKLAVKYDEKEANSEIKNKVVLANELRKALKEGKTNKDGKGLILYYQRQVDCHDKRTCGAEVLIRWDHPTRGFISPAQFLPVAEEFDLMFDLDKFVFINAAKDLYELTKKGIELPISINLSSASLCNPKIVDLISAVISRIKINPKLLTIEITESAFIEEKQKSKEIVEQIKALGLNIALDDFCTGYSSMEYLLSYSADYLKIDREFIKEIHTDEQRKHIVKGLITIAQSLGMSVIAEGVEKKEEANELVKMNCNSIQGYFFGKPQKLEELLEVVTNLGYSRSKGQVRFSDNSPAIAPAI